MSQNKIAIRHVDKVFSSQGRQVQALQDVNLDIRTNEFVTFVGASGCGKSTLLRSIGGLERHSGGEILVDGRAVDGPGIDRAMVFQHYSLYPWLRVMENIKFCRRLKVVSDTVRGDADVEVASGRADALLNLMGLSAFAQAYPSQLSGGMQQRVEIARVLINQPRLLLMDEPFGALDAQTRMMMQELLLDIWTRLRTSVLFITHDIDEALFLADRILVMSPRPGRILEDIRLDFPRPRHADLLTTPEFSRLKRHCLELLRHEDGRQLPRLTPLGLPTQQRIPRFAI